MRTFERLLQSGIPLDWTTSRLGWHGLKNMPFFDGLHAYACLMTTQELLAYAKSQVGYCSDAEADAVFDLAYSDASDAWTIQRCLDRLASNNPEAIERAMRIWKWGLLDDVLNNLEEAHEQYSNQVLKGPWEIYEWVYDASWEVEQLWEECRFPLADLAFIRDLQNRWISGPPDAKEILAKPRVWLEEEKERLMAHSGE